MYSDIRIERSQQTIPLSQELEPFLARSRALHELSEIAPSVPGNADVMKVNFPFSNDESAAYFDQTQARVYTPEYQQATNRVAMLIGESSLASALPYISEETIILLDRSPTMCAYMKTYVEGLRQASSVSQWADFVGMPKPEELPHSREADTLVKDLFVQVDEWSRAGYVHGLVDEEAFDKACELAKEKAIIPWQGDISSSSDMARLGEALRGLGANITMLNLSNAICVDKTFDDTREYAETLASLPITPNAPILATGGWSKLGPHLGRTRAVEATGPFFGLENLGEWGGSSLRINYGSIGERKYFPCETASQIDNSYSIQFGALVEVGSPSKFKKPRLRPESELRPDEVFEQRREQLIESRIKVMNRGGKERVDDMAEAGRAYLEALDDFHPLPDSSELTERLAFAEQESQARMIPLLSAFNESRRLNMPQLLGGAGLVAGGGELAFASGQDWLSPAGAALGAFTLAGGIPSSTAEGFGVAGIMDSEVNLRDLVLKYLEAEEGYIVGMLYPAVKKAQINRVMVSVAAIVATSIIKYVVPN